MIDLRPYQVEAIDGARAKLAEGVKRCLVILPTGGGKTVVAASIIQAAEQKGKRVVFLAHRKELIDQTADKLLRFGVRPGIIRGNHPTHYNRQVQVASVQSLVNRPGELGQVDLIFVDECHHVAKGNTYDKLLGWWPSARVVGLTATPWRLDGAGLADIFDGHVIVRTPRQLRDEGFLVPVVGFEYSPISTAAAKVSGGDYTGKSLEAGAMSLKLFGEIVGEWKRHAGGGRTVLFACTIAHSAAMAEAFRAAGVAAEHLDGETPADERAGILSRIKSGETRVLCNVNVCTEGWDAPELECAILARPTLSTVLALQMCGRILRPSEGKGFARIHDHARVLATHGHPYVDRDFSPEKSTKLARSAAEFNVKRGLRCPKCRGVIDRYPCTNCGHEPTPVEIATQQKALRRELTDTPAWNKVRADIAKQSANAEKWALHSTETKKAIFDGLQRKRGTRAAVGAYRAMSGETEWPPAQWRLEPNFYGAPR